MSLFIKTFLVTVALLVGTGGGQIVENDTRYSPEALHEFAQDTGNEIVVPPALPVNEQGLPISPSRNKFPKASGLNVDLVEAVNIVVNHTMTYTRDIEQYGVSEHWVMSPSSLMGDCEDYALTKLAILQQVGVPIISRTQLVTLHVKQADGSLTGHAILALRFESDEVAYLDNNYDRIMTREELVSQGYVFYDW